MYIKKIQWSDYPDVVIEEVPGGGHDVDNGDQLIAILFKAEVGNKALQNPVDCVDR